MIKVLVVARHHENINKQLNKIQEVEHQVTSGKVAALRILSQKKFDVLICDDIESVPEDMLEDKNMRVVRLKNEDIRKVSEGKLMRLLGIEDEEPEEEEVISAEGAKLSEKQVEEDSGEEEIKESAGEAAEHGGPKEKETNGETGTVTQIAESKKKTLLVVSEREEILDRLTRYSDGELTGTLAMSANIGSQLIKDGGIGVCLYDPEIEDVDKLIAPARRMSVVMLAIENATTTDRAGAQRILMELKRANEGESARPVVIEESPKSEEKDGRSNKRDREDAELDLTEGKGPEQEEHGVQATEEKERVEDEGAKDKAEKEKTEPKIEISPPGPEEDEKQEPGGKNEGASKELAAEVYKIARASEKKKEKKVAESVAAPKHVIMKPQVIAVWRTEGGAGATAFSCNLAHYLGKVGIHGVMLMDLNFTEGGSDAGFILDAAITPYIEKPKDGEIKHMIQKGKGYKFGFLQSPPTMEFGEMIQAEDVREILDIATKTHTAVVVDMPNDPNPRVAAVLERADTLFIISTLADWPLARAKTIMEDLGIPARVVLVGNRTGGTKKNLKTLAQVIGVEAGGVIADDKALKAALDAHQINENGIFYGGVKRIANMYLFGLNGK